MKTVSTGRQIANVSRENAAPRATVQAQTPKAAEQPRRRGNGTLVSIVFFVWFVVAASLFGRGMHAVFSAMGTNGYLVFAGLSLVASAWMWLSDGRRLRISGTTLVVGLLISLGAVVAFFGPGLRAVFNAMGASGYLVFAGMALVASAWMWISTARTPVR
jgi:hypothetical protein